jgi:hypothetical protein
MRTTTFWLPPAHTALADRKHGGLMPTSMRETTHCTRIDPEHRAETRADGPDRAIPERDLPAHGEERLRRVRAGSSDRSR